MWTSHSVFSLYMAVERVLVPCVAQNELVSLVFPKSLSKIQNLSNLSETIMLKRNCSFNQQRIIIRLWCRSVTLLVHFILIGVIFNCSKQFYFPLELVENKTELKELSIIVKSSQFLFILHQSTTKIISWYLTWAGLGPQSFTVKYLRNTENPISKHLITVVRIFYNLEGRELGADPRL